MHEQGNTSDPGEAVRSTLEDFLLARSANSPVWRTASTLAYLANESGTYQVHELDLTTGESRQLTSFAEPVSMLVSASRTDRLVFGVDSGGNERHQLWTIDGDGAPQRRTIEDDVIHQGPVLAAGGRYLTYASNSRARQFFDVWVADLEAGTAHLAWAIDGWLAPLAWAPDGSALLVRRSNTNLDHDLFLIGPDGDGTPHPLTPHEGEATVAAAAFEPGGGAILIATNQDGDIARLVRLDVVSGEQRVLAGGEWDVEALAPSPSSLIAFAVNEDGGSRLFLHDAATGQTTPVSDTPPAVVSGLAWSPDGDRLAFAVNGARMPSCIWIHEVGGPTRTVVRSGTTQRLPESLCQPETIRYTSFDGLDVPAFWFRPAVSSGKIPVVVYVHGGPESQLRLDFSPFTQYLVDRGYAVLAPNVRGSTGYGKRYHHLDDRERRPDAVADLAAAVDWLRTQPEVDATQIAVMGRSYGGFMVLAALTSYPNLWAAGVDIVGIADFQSFFQRTGPWRRQMRADEYGDPEKDADLLRSISPLHRAEQIVAPLIVLHGRNDPRVPVEEAEQIVSRLRAIGRDVDLVIYEDEGHLFGKEPNQIASFRAIAQFLDRVLS